jgi:hypothetical protein
MNKVALHYQRNVATFMHTWTNYLSAFKKQILGRIYEADLPLNVSS